MSRTEPARYFPFVYDEGRYEVKAGLYPIETDFGNGVADRTVFQCDAFYADYVAAKRAAADRAAAGSAALRVSIDERCSPEVLRHTHAYMCAQLVRERHVTAPELDHWELDELVLHLQQDVAIVEPVAGGATRLSYLHVSLPSGWSPWTKRGKTFAEVHKPVPGIARIDGDALMTDIIEHGQVRQRFSWGVQFDARLDQHPKRGRRAGFDATAGLWLRVERQVVVGLSAVRAMLFLIHPYVVPIADVLSDAARGSALISAVESMSDDQLRYKGLRRDRAAVVAFLKVHLRSP